VCVCAVLFYAELVFKLKSDTIHTRTTSTLLRVRLSAGMSLCSFFYIIFFPCNSSEDIPLSVQRAVSYGPNEVLGRFALFFTRSTVVHDWRTTRRRLTYYGRANGASAFQKAITGGPGGYYYIFVRSTVVEVKHLSKLNRSKNRDLCRATEYNNNNNHLVQILGFHVSY